MVTFEQYQAARAEMGAVNLAYDVFDGCGWDHPEHAALQARYAAAKAVSDDYWKQPDPEADAHNARLIAQGDAE